MKNTRVTIMRIELSPIWGLQHQLLSSGIVYYGIMLLLIWQTQPVPGANGGLEVAQMMCNHRQVSLSLRLSITGFQGTIMTIFQIEALRSRSNTWTGEIIANYPKPLAWRTWRWGNSIFISMIYIADLQKLQE